LIDIIYLDTSAYMRLFRTEPGSAWLRTFIAGKHLYSSELLRLEAATTLGRLYREGFYTKERAAEIYHDIFEDLKVYRLIPLGNLKRIQRAVSFAFNLPVTMRIRALDAIHLAAALSAKEDANNLTPPASFTFVSADRQLLNVAAGLGMATENPESYP
jgi:predicted nucleic acid-binding protein